MAVEVMQRTTGIVPDQRERDRMRVRPAGRPTMLQTWRDLVFLHFPVSPQTGQRLLPAGLTIDTYPDDWGREMAWIGLVAFRLQNIRPPWGPALPWLSAFNEVNVRTYAHLEGRQPSVWFCSLDGAPWPVRTIAKLWYRVPYVAAHVIVDPHRPSYVSRRPDGRGARIDVEPGSFPSPARPGTLEWFLFERYQLFSCSGGQIYSAKVAHAPYQMQRAEVVQCETDLCSGLGIPEQDRLIAHYCAEVHAEFFCPRKVRSR